MTRFHLIAAVLALTLLPALSNFATAATDKDTAPLGPIGWRGDWTGRYPAATPPTEWGYWPKSPSWGLRYQLKKPAANDTGTSATEVKHGMLMEWLVLGPFGAKDPKTAVDEEFLPREAELQPDENEKSGELTWTRHLSVNKEGGGRPFGHQCENDLNHFDHITGAKPNGVVYAFLNLNAQTKGKLEIFLDQQKGAKIWVNGKVVHNNPNPASVTPQLNYVCYAAEVLFADCHTGVAYYVH